MNYRLCIRFVHIGDNVEFEWTSDFDAGDKVERVEFDFIASM